MAIILWRHWRHAWRQWRNACKHFWRHAKLTSRDGNFFPTSRIQNVQDKKWCVHASWKVQMYSVLHNYVKEKFSSNHAFRLRPGSFCNFVCSRATNLTQNRTFKMQNKKNSKVQLMVNDETKCTFFYNRIFAVDLLKLNFKIFPDLGPSVSASHHFQWD